jgi:Zn finger protein HypA/HybF involved in hydrogenase expression
MAKPATCPRCTELRAAIDRHLARCNYCHQGLMNVIGDLDAQVLRLRAENDRLRAELTAREHVR